MFTLYLLWSSLRCKDLPLEGSLEETSSAGWAVPIQTLAANISSGEEMESGLVAWT